MAILTEAKKLAPVSYWEACHRGGCPDGTDIADDDFDFLIYLGVPEEKRLADCEDWYDRFSLLLALNLECVRFGSDVSVCKIAGFIESNRSAFDRFMEEENAEGYRPSDWQWPLSADEDSEYYEVYLRTIYNLIAGNYSDRQYEKLCGLLLSEEG